MSAEAKTQLLRLPQVSDYELIRCVGSGAFGDVWLARAKATNRFRAIKLVSRSRFPQASLYETEFTGLKKFEELSREHAGFIDILHVSRDDQAGCFSYVMELADDLEAGQSFDPGKYVSKTVASELGRRQIAGPAGQGRFTPAECVEAALNITAALSTLHQNGLVHRDIKPSNIVFVRGLAKLADVGLVTDLKLKADDGTLIGSPTFMDEQAHGTAQGDLFGFGKVLYMMATGRDAQDWPNLPDDLEGTEDPETFRELHHISLKACHANRAQRYRSAQEIHDELLLLRAGQSAQRLHRLERLVVALKRFGFMLALIAALAALLLYQAGERRKEAAELRQHKVGSYVAYGTRALEENDLLGALPWFAEALRQDGDDPRTAPAHRRRLGALLQQCPTIVQMWFTDHPFNFAQFAGQENQVLLPTADHHWAIHDLATGGQLYPPFGSGGSDETISLSPATHLAAVGNSEVSNHMVGIWNFVTGQEYAKLSCDSPVWGVALSPDARWVAASSGSNVIVWNLETRQRVRVLAGHSEPIFSLAFSPDAHRLVTASADATAIVWDPQEGRALTTFTNHQHWVYFAVFSPDGKRVASSSFDRSVRVWEAETGREVLPPLRHGDGVRGVQFSADGTRLVTAGLDFSVRVWDAATGALLQQLRHNSKPISAGFSPSGRHIITACYDGTERVWELRSSEPAPDSVLDVCSGDGSCVAVQTNQAILILAPVNPAGSGRPSGADFKREAAPSAQGSRQPLASISSANLKLLRVWLNQHGTRLLAIAEPDSGSPSTNVQAILWDSKTGSRIGSAPLLDRRSTNLVFSPAGGQILAFAHDRPIVWDFERDQEILRLPEEPKRAAFDPAGRRLATAVSTNVQVWDLATAQPLLRVPWPHDTTVDSLEWSPDGRYLVTACWDTSFDPEYAQVWDPSTGARAGPRLPHRDGVRFATFSPDGKKVVTCGEDFTAMLWDWRTGRQLTPPLRHKHLVVHAAFSPDGRWLATACRDHTARVWDAETGEPITQPLQHPEGVVQVQWVDAGSALLTRTKTGQARLWNLPYDNRPLEKLVLISELLSAEQIHATESAMPETKEALQKLWRRLRFEYPAAFSLP